MIKEELKKIVDENRAMRRKKEDERLKKQQEKQALEDELMEKWRESNKTEIEEKIERCFIESAKKADGCWIRVDASWLTINNPCKTDGYWVKVNAPWLYKKEFFDVYEITDEDVKEYCKRHKIKVRYWYHREENSFTNTKGKDKYVHRYMKSSYTGFRFKGYAIHI